VRAARDAVHRGDRAAEPVLAVRARPWGWAVPRRSPGPYGRRRRSPRRRARSRSRRPGSGSPRSEASERRRVPELSMPLKVTARSSVPSPSKSALVRARASPKSYPSTSVVGVTVVSGPGRRTVDPPSSPFTVTNEIPAAVPVVVPGREQPPEPRPPLATAPTSAPSPSPTAHTRRPVPRSCAAYTARACAAASGCCRRLRNGLAGHPDLSR
jgi:hypothetical protein